MKGLITNLDAPTPDYVLGAYHQLWQIEKSFRMSKSDLRARPIYHHKPDSIEAHLTIVMAALAVSRWLERVTGWSIKKLVQTLRRYRSIAVQAGDHILHAGTPSTTTCEQPSTPSRPQPLDTKLSQVGNVAQETGRCSGADGSVVTGALLPHDTNEINAVSRSISHFRNRPF